MPALKPVYHNLQGAKYGISRLVPHGGELLCVAASDGPPLHRCRGSEKIGWTLYSRICKFAEGEGFVSSFSIRYPPLRCK